MTREKGLAFGRFLLEHLHLEGARAVNALHKEHCPLLIQGVEHESGHLHVVEIGDDDKPTGANYLIPFDCVKDIKARPEIIS